MRQSGKVTSFPQSVDLKPGETVVRRHHHLSLARAPRRGQRQGHEGSAHGRHGPEDRCRSTASACSSAASSRSSARPRRRRPPSNPTCSSAAAARRRSITTRQRSAPRSLMMMRFKDNPDKPGPRQGAGRARRQDHARVAAHRRLRDHDVGRHEVGAARFPVHVAVAVRADRGRGRPPVQCAGQGRHRADADRQDVLLAALRRRRRQVRRVVDGHRRSRKLECQQNQPQQREPVMSTKMFVNLPVKDLAKSIAFYKALGFTFNPQFTDDTAACMVISEHNYAMLLTHEKFRVVHDQADPGRAARQPGCWWRSRSKASRPSTTWSTKAIKAGGKEPRPKADYRLHGPAHVRGSRRPHLGAVLHGPGARGEKLETRTASAASSWSTGRRRRSPAPRAHSSTVAIRWRTRRAVSRFSSQMGDRTLSASGVPMLATGVRTKCENA